MAVNGPCVAGAKLLNRDPTAGRVGRADRRKRVGRRPLPKRGGASCGSCHFADRNWFFPVRRIIAGVPSGGFDVLVYGSPCAGKYSAERRKLRCAYYAATLQQVCLRAQGSSVCLGEAGIGKRDVASNVVSHFPLTRVSSGRLIGKGRAISAAWLATPTAMRSWAIWGWESVMITITAGGLGSSDALPALLIRADSPLDGFVDWASTPSVLAAGRLAQLDAKGIEADGSTAVFGFVVEAPLYAVE